MKKFLSVGFCVALMSGCASQIKIYDAEKNEMPGVPVNQPLLVEVVKETSYKVAPGSEHQAYEDLCKEKVENSNYEFLPLGERHYIGFDAAALGKGEFKLEFNDSGVMKIVSVNSDASAGLDSVTSFIEKTLPFFKAPKVADEAADLRADTTAELRSKHCLEVGTTVKGVYRIDVQPSRAQE
ncbi:hypothetical protein K6U66_02795 [Vibrio alginolyticus]|uniref:hypothetical protein n=1 Tax=Vibrio alginolyticus TaxID=663 RepID=UPI001EEA9AF0|nr:hypothetical protein [Vibrio alginolyticus]MCG6316723.1 hypothetical protein [Vibrio alginolyticus]